MTLSGIALNIKASGIVSKTIEEGAYVALQVKYGLIRLISTKADLCEQVKNVDKECPIEAGLLTFEKSVDLPEQIPNVRRSNAIAARRRNRHLLTATPQGKYTVLADVYTKDDKPITCLTATVVFGAAGKAEIEL